MKQLRAAPVTVRQQVAVGGQVSNGHSGKAMADVRIRLSGDKIERQTTTSAGGLFYFCNLPAGEYTVSAEMPGESKRLSTAAGKAVVVYDADGRIQDRAFLDLVLSPTRVEGRVIGKATKKGVVLAKVRIKGSGESAFTDLEGRYTLAGIEASAAADRIVEAVSQGYKPATQRVRIAEPGGVAKADFHLVKESDKGQQSEA